MHFSLPESLEPYRQEIEATLKPCIRLKPVKAATKAWQSKFGGFPYMPLSSPIEHFDYNKRYMETPFPYPRDWETGFELNLLAQLNFEEIPPLDSFPKKGILQVFDTGYGMNPNDKFDQTSFRIVYHPEVIKDDCLLWTDHKQLGEEYKRQKEKEHALKFTAAHEPVSMSDYRFNTVYTPEAIQAIYKEWSFYYDLSRSADDFNRNKIGGYHYSQNDQDPRRQWQGGNTYTNPFHEEESVLLIQFDGCHGPFSWGDGGTACFFIKKKDLQNLDFSQVLYHWDST